MRKISRMPQSEFRLYSEDVDKTLTASQEEAKREEEIIIDSDDDIFSEFVIVPKVLDKSKYN